MKLLYIVHQFLPRHVTGTEQHVLSLAKGMIDRGHEVQIIAYEPQIQAVSLDRGWFASDETVHGVDVHRFGVNLTLADNHALMDYHNPIALELLDRFLAGRRFDIAHVFHLRFLGAGVIGHLQRYDLPVVVNLMDFWFLCPNFILLRNDGTLCDGPPERGLGCVACLDGERGRQLATRDLGDALLDICPDAPLPRTFGDGLVDHCRALIGRKERLLGALGQASAVLAPSRFLASVFAAAGFESDRLQHCPYGVDARRLTGRGARRAGDDDRILRVGYIGSITEHKGLHILVAAVRGLRTDSIRLSIHGHLSTHPAYSERVQKLAAGDSRIEFRGGFEPDALGDVLADLDVVVVPSLWYENTPFSVLEALAFGVPVVASQLGGMAEIVEDGVNGFLVTAGDVESLSERLADLASDRSRLKSLRIDEVRSLDDNLDDLLKIYGSLTR